jgi:hypothetical protein
MYGLVLALHHDARFIKRPGSVERAKKGFERLIFGLQDEALSSSSKPLEKKASKKISKTL